MQKIGRHTSSNGKTTRLWQISRLSPKNIEYRYFSTVWALKRCVFTMAFHSSPKRTRKSCPRLWNNWTSSRLARLTKPTKGRNQEGDESIDAYVAALRKLAQTCNFCECLNDTLIRDRIVLGVKSKHLHRTKW